MKQSKPTTFDILVVGGGHAGIEASIVAARMGMRVGLVSMDFATVGRLSCNPSIGGSAKGHLAKEIDALGGVMPRIADASGLQFKMLNTSKGPAVWSPRSQNDKDLYPLYAQNAVLSTNNLTVINETVTEIVVERDRVTGVRTLSNEEISAKAVILCSGTFLNAVMWTGTDSTNGGRVGERPAEKISDLLTNHGLTRGRLKTGTPPRIAKGSIDFTKLEPLSGDEVPAPFSMHTRRVRNRLACFASRTNDATHDLLRIGFTRSPMFTGLITGAGPRYCPSIEDKIFRFSDKSSHVIVLEPEGMSTDTVYVNGFSTSLPQDIQDAGIRTIPGLKDASILRYGYAVEYDFFFPYQLTFGLQTKAIQGLFFAGQINGTSGYEEAAAQGLIAGINAALFLRDEGSFTLQRSEAYIGVMIDDLVNKNTEEPYRIFTSLAEYRLLLRIDTVYDRLMPHGRRLGLIDDGVFNRFERQSLLRDQLETDVRTSKITPEIANPYLASLSEDPIPETTTLFSLVKRPTVRISPLLNLAGRTSASIRHEHPAALHAAETQMKYEGYIQKLYRDVERYTEQEHMMIPTAFEYSRVQSLSTEGREKLQRIRPASLGQASRIPGVSASDVSILALYLR
ncbi:MAG: tRNA uridine-5-carboxymethylaminomethyl(34) synthesis enzyme MnmG [Candidatus Kapabacteria bacterium]|nr:tRNA uridine-5-carboxymethylaminomethyl(34) synthesis enzyme MnmG [Candidatus Kapabacteria bacterium]